MSAATSQSAIGNQQSALREDLLRVITCGSVDDGKSTLIGRLLYDTKSLWQDQVDTIEQASRQRGNQHLDLSLFTDGLRAEREQGITIDVAYRYFSTARRKFILADTPGHVQYTRNMVTGASTANLAIVLLDARKGITEQTRRHLFLCSLLQVRHLAICINKMDLVGFAETVYENIRQDCLHYISKLSIPDVQFVPVSALRGDNVVEKSVNMPWFRGGTLLYLLETVHVSSDHQFVDSRFPVQYVIRPRNDEFPDFRGYAGRVEGGVFKPGDEVMVLPSGFTTRIANISTFDGNLPKAYPPLSVTFTLEDELDISRGDMLVKPNNQPTVSQDIEAMLCWLNARPLQPNGKYILKHTTREVKCLLKEVLYKIDISSLHRAEDDFSIGLNDIGKVRLRTTAPLFFDAYSRNRQTGSFILIDAATNETVGAGMLV